jgi:hypothetical protein
VTVHVEVAGAVTVPGEQLRLLGTTAPGGGALTGSEIDPELPESGIEAPAAVEVTTPVIWIGIGLAEGFDAIWKVATATVPSAMTVESNPYIKQVFPEQVTDLPAFVAEPPAATVTPVMSDVKLNDHSIALTLPEDAVVRGRLTVPPGAPEPEPRESVTPWPEATHANASKLKRM